MGSFTAQILVGQQHPNHGGINPSHYLFLSENSRPAWVLVNQNVSVEDDYNYEKVTWIPTVENTLEDAILMVAVHVLQNPEILKLAEEMNPIFDAERLELYEAFSGEQRNLLYEACRDLSGSFKLAISVFEGSLVRGQLAALKNYKMDLEVCPVTFSRIYSEWKMETIIEGKLYTKQERTENGERRRKST